MYRHASENLPPELVSPVVAFLAHEKCPVTGECIDAVATHRTTIGNNAKRDLSFMLMFLEGHGTA